MNDITDFLKNGVQQSVSDVQDALITRAEGDALETHAILDMQERIEEINQRFEKFEAESKQAQKMERRRFISNFIVCVISAVAAIVGAAVAIIALLA